ncbi:MAG: ABC transporter permease [Candidatus Acidiferrales bacterium]|jgi:ABC-2 type transport system permease protein|nr:ABC transporter permease [Candidatus Acidoferrales bacterium]
MRGLYAIYRKEMSHYFVSPVAYVVVPMFLILSAVFFNMYLADGIKASFEASMEAMQGGAPIPFDVPSAVTGAFLSLVGTILLFLTPLLTMGVYSEERKRGTMELLLTSPITDGQIVLGKFFASLSLFIIMILPTVLYVVYMFAHSEPVPPWKLIAGGYLGVLLLGATLLAIGSFLSALTENQIVAGVLVLGISLLLWVVGFFAGTGNGLIAQTLQYVAILQHYNPFVRGVIDTTGLIFFGSWIFFAIFLTMRAVDSMRWRRA